MKLVLLPGLDGTGQLFQPLVDQCYKEVATVVVAYARAQVQTYQTLLAHVNKQLPQDQPYVLVAESFSGPLAIWIGAEQPPNLKGIVLCNTFAQSPVPGWLRILPWSLFFRVNPPYWAIRYLLAGQQASTEECSTIAAAIRSVTTDVLAARVHEVLRVDAQSALEQVTVPRLFLRSTNDPLISNRSFNKTIQLQPNLWVKTLPGPHLLLQTMPYESWQLIKTFMQQHVY